MLASSLVGWLLSIQLQRVISDPMLHLVQTAKTVSDRMDYSVRAVKHTEDELGLLIDSFNHMLAQIEKRDAALTALSSHLDELYRLSTAMQEPLSLGEHLTRVLEAARQVVAIDRFHVWAVARSGDRLAALAGAGFAPDEWRDFEATEIPLVEAGPMYRAYLEGVPLVFNEANPLPPELQLRSPYSELKAIRTSSFVVIPMIARGQPVGLFTADNERSCEPILPHTVHLLQIFASHAAVAIENARLFQEIEGKGRELEIASKHKSQFLANMSHELRTPLNAVLGYTELILDDIFGEVPLPIRDTLERMRSNGLHLLGLINDVLDLSKIEAGQLTLSLGEYSMDEVVNTAISSLRSLAEEKRLALKALVAPDLPLGHGDERRIAQALLNLVGNAIKFTEVGEITVEATAADGRFLVSVSDTGPGIAPGRSAEDLRGVPAGRQLQHAQEGRHRPRSVDLPADPRAAPGSHRGRVEPGPGLHLLVHAAGARGSPGRASMSKRILVIEDQEDNRRILRYLLRSANYEVLEAVTGEDGVALAEGGRPNLILMDIQLPGLDGYEATRRIKANPGLRHIPIIVVTSYAMSGDDIKAFAAGCDAYVTKPFSPRQLLAKIQEHL
jgi:CheY-like chemotaxis protein/GAF domain-containing protein